MKQNNLSVTIGTIALTTIFIVLFVVGYTVLHQIVNFFTTSQRNGLYGFGYIKN